MVDFHSDRPGYLRYGLDGTKMQKMGWSLLLILKPV